MPIVFKSRMIDCSLSGIFATNNHSMNFCQQVIPIYYENKRQGKLIRKMHGILKGKIHTTMNTSKMNTFIQELRTLLGDKYTVEFNTDADTHGGARILIHSDFNCNKYVITKRGFNRRGEPAEEGDYRPCCTCHCKRGCNVSDEFENLVEKYNFRYAFHCGPTIGLWRK